MHSSFTAPVSNDIIIVGAGISGMTAAFHILHRDPSLSVLVLEANNRIGGRTLSVPLRLAENNCYRSFEFGGQFVLASQVHLMDLLQKLDLHISKPCVKQGKAVWSLSTDKTATLLQNVLDFKQFQEWIELFKFFEKIDTMSMGVSFNSPHSIPNSHTLDMQTMETFITENLNTPRAQNFVRHVIRTSCGVEPGQVTVLFYLAFCNATDGIQNQCYSMAERYGKMWIKEGADAICQRIADIIGRRFIKMGDPVIEIARDPVQVFVETQKEIYQCRYVIVATPPAEILGITFYPPLTRSRYDLLQSLEKGHFIKFVATYQKAFWKERGYSGEIVGCGKQSGQGPIHWCCDITSNSCPALTGYIAASDCLKQPVITYKKEVLRQLAAYFGEDALNPIDYHEKCWLEEPYIYSCIMNSPGMGNMDKYPEMKRPLGRLFWAGAETATYWNGYLGGAVQAGYRAAIEVLYDFRPQVLTIADIQLLQTEPRRRRKMTRRVVSGLVTHGTNWKILLPIAGLLFTLFYFRQRIRESLLSRLEK